MGHLYTDQSETESVPAPLAELTGTYHQCLSISCQYAAETITDDPDQAVDLDALEQFIAARGELFAMAEANLNDLTGCSESPDQESARRALTSKVVAILEEMAEVESQLSTFLHERLAEMRQTIGQMQKAQPVFKRYGYLGGPRAPSRITRHE